MLALLLLLVPLTQAAPGPRDWLWHIVDECVDAAKPDYCARCQRPIDGSCGAASCADSIALWGATGDYVAVRDRKMCGCSDNFVHGLALPRRPVKGIEDPAAPAGLWAFAWEQARVKIGDERDILLAVNAPFRRTQDQLHVHLLRLRSDAVKALEAAGGERITSLDDAWAAAARHAKRQGLRGWYGVAVARARDGDGYLVVAEAAGQAEATFGQALCR